MLRRRRASKHTNTRTNRQAIKPPNDRTNKQTTEQTNNQTHEQASRQAHTRSTTPTEAARASGLARARCTVREGMRRGAAGAPGRVACEGARRGQGRARAAAPRASSSRASLASRRSGWLLLQRGATSEGCRMRGQARRVCERRARRGTRHPAREPGCFVCPALQVCGAAPGLALSGSAALRRGGLSCNMLRCVAARSGCLLFVQDSTAAARQHELQSEEARSPA